MNEMPT